MKELIGEAHITYDIKQEDIGIFKTCCLENGIKPIVIELENDSRKTLQVMTSGVCSRFDLEHHKAEFSKKLLEKIEVLTLDRLKFEIKPDPLEKHPDHIYYASHLRLLLPKNYDRTELHSMCKALNFHMSKNLLKQSDDVDHQMITYRSTETYAVFMKSIVAMTGALVNAKIRYDKLEIEECIYDSNLNLDDVWFK